MTMRWVHLKLPVLFVLGASLASCVTVTSRPVSYGGPVSARANDPNRKIEVCSSAFERRPFAVVGEASVTVKARSSAKRAMSELRAQARRLGGDALLDIQHGEAGGTVLAPVGGMVVAQKLRETWTAKVIVFEEAPSMDSTSETSSDDANHGHKSKRKDADDEAMEARDASVARPAPEEGHISRVFESGRVLVQRANGDQWMLVPTESCPWISGDEQEVTLLFRITGVRILNRHGEVCEFALDEQL